jgi:hypothetical protein
VATFAANSQFNGTGSLKVPVGTTGERPTPALGMVRYNSTLNQYEGYISSAWSGLGGSAAGSNTQVQYNNSGVLAGSANLTFDGTKLTTVTASSTNISDGTNTTSTTNVIKGSAKSWINFNAGGIVESFNVSSLTRSAAGDYTINFTNAMANSNYSFAMSTTCDAASANYAQFIGVYTTNGTIALMSTTQLRILIKTQSGSISDATVASVAIFS